MSATGCIISNRNEAEIIDVLGIVQVTMRIRNMDTNGVIAVFEERVPAGYGVPYHTHLKEDEMFRILEGTYQIWVGGQTFTAHVGDTVMLPRGVPHTFRNISTVSGLTLNTYSPGGFDDFIREFAKLPPMPDLTELGELGERYGIHYSAYHPWDFPQNDRRLDTSLISKRDLLRAPKPEHRGAKELYER